MANDKSFFEKQNLLDAHVITTSKKEFVETQSLAVILENLAKEKYIVAAFLVNEIRFGLCDFGKLFFVDTSTFDERHLLEMRLFNTNEEIYLRKINGKYMVRVITDGNDGVACEVVDTQSNLFGTNIKIADLPDNYVCLVEEGRKIKMVIPVNELAKHYALKTRSYMSYDEETGQVGFAYYRYVDVCVSDRGQEKWM